MKKIVSAILKSLFVAADLCEEFSTKHDREMCVSIVSFWWSVLNVLVSHACHHCHENVTSQLIINLFITSSALFCWQLEEEHVHSINIYTKFIMKYKACPFSNCNNLEVNRSEIFILQWHFMQTCIQFWINTDSFLQSLAFLWCVEHIFFYFVTKILCSLCR